MVLILLVGAFHGLVAQVKQTDGLVGYPGIEPGWPKRWLYRPPRLHSGLVSRSTTGGIRTRNHPILSRAPLPVGLRWPECRERDFEPALDARSTHCRYQLGYRDARCRRRDSNPHSAGFESATATSWATPARASQRKYSDDAKLRSWRSRRTRARTACTSYPYRAGSWTSSLEASSIRADRLASIACPCST